MPSIWLYETPERIQEATIFLQAVLHTGQNVIHIESDSADAYQSKTLNIGYRTIDDEIRVRPRQQGSDSSHIFIPVGLGINIRTAPLLHEGARYQSYIDQQGDFLHIYTPYYYLQDKSRVDLHKHVLILQKDNQE